MEAPEGGVGWVSHDRAPAEPSCLASHSPSGSDYITLQGSGSLSKIQRYVPSRITHHGNFSMGLGLLAPSELTYEVVGLEKENKCVTLVLNTTRVC